MSTRLEDKVAVVTGGSAGIGLGIAKRFAAEGAQVFITGRRQAALDAACEQIGGDVTAVRADASKLSDLDRLYSVVRSRVGRIDVLALNAGFYATGTLGAVTEEHFDETFDTNVRGVFFAMQKALPLLAPGASVILLGSIASSKGMPSFSVYAATKAAVRAFARGWIVDLKGRDVRINVLSPGYTDTPGVAELMNADQKEAARATVPLGRLGTADDVAKAALFLASDESSYVTGAEFSIDGGAGQY